MPIATAAVITCSDRVSRGDVEDRSGPAVRDFLLDREYDCAEPVVVADEIDEIVAAIRDAIANSAELVVTTGGTGIAERDVTPEATDRIAGKRLPGFGEVMRRHSIDKVPTAALSRAQAVVSANALVINVPGSPRGAVENLEAVIDLVPHALELIRGHTDHEKMKQES